MGLYYAAERYKNAKLPESSIMKPNEWLKSFFGGSSTNSGINVDAKSALSFTSIFNAITLVSENMGYIPFAPYVKETVTDPESNQTRTNRSVYRTHPTYMMVSKRPHPLISSFNFRKVMFAWVCLHDNAYAVIERNRIGRAVSMFPIHPKRVYPKINDNKELVYVVDGDKELDPMSIFHLIGYTDNGLAGESRIEIAKESIGKAIAANEFGAKYFGKGINVSGFLKTEKMLKDQDSVDRLKKSFIKALGGKNNQLGVGLLEGGTDFVPNEIDPMKAQLVEVFKNDVTMVAQLFNLPVTMLKLIENATHSNVEELYIQFVNALIPWGVNWEQESWYKLLTEREKREGNVDYKFNFNGLLRGDMTARAKFYESLAKVGAYSPNRILELEDENGYDGGDVHIINPGANSVENIGNETDTTI